MKIDEKVITFIADLANIPISDIRDDMNIAEAIDWSRVHPDEYRDFFEYFIKKFNIYVPKYDFRQYIKQHDVAWYNVPFFTLSMYFLRNQRK